MTYAPTYRDFNDFFRGPLYGRHDIFTARSYDDFVRRHDIDLTRAISRFDDAGLAGTIVFAQRGARAWLALMGVRQDLRRRGYGRALFALALDSVRASGATHIEFEVVIRNAGAIAMYRGFGFREHAALRTWARSARSGGNRLRFCTRTADELETFAARPSACWQREPRSLFGIAHALLRVDGGYACVRSLDRNAIVLDAHARDTEAASALVHEMNERVASDITVFNEPADSALSVALEQAGWRVVERQHRMFGV